MKKPLSMGFVALLVLSMAMLMVPAGQVVYEPHPAPAIWMDPSFTDNLNKCHNFTVSIVVNITDPPGAGTGMYMWEYKLYWNTSWLSLVDHDPVIIDGVTDVILGWGDYFAVAKDNVGADYHWYAVTAIQPAPAFTGVVWLCNYTFHVEDEPLEPEPPYVGEFPFYLEAICDEEINDILPPETDWVIGTFRISRSPCKFSVTWKWLDWKNDSVWFTAYVNISGCCQAVQNSDFNHSLGQISFNITSVTSGFCNVTVPKLLMDGAFKVLINDTLVPSILTWNQTHTFIYFTYDSGTHNVKIKGEIVTRIRGADLLSLSDVNGDGKINIKDIGAVAVRFGWKEDC